MVGRSAAPAFRAIASAGTVAALLAVAWVPGAGAVVGAAGSAVDRQTEEPAEIVVGDDGDVATVRQALERARDGDRIRIRPGVYREGPLVVERSVTLEGESGAVLDGEGEHTILEVRAHDVTVRGLEIRNSGFGHAREYAGIRVDRVHRCVVEDNVVRNTHFGVYLARARGCRVEGNDIEAAGTRETMSGNAVHLWNAAGVTVTDNRIVGHRDGIYLEFSEDVVARDNRVEDNLRYGLHFMFSHGGIYEDNAFRRNGAGVAIMYTRDVQLRNNLFSDNWGATSYGLLIKDVQDSLVESNRFVNNTTAIFADAADDMIFRRNQVERNGWAVRILANSQGNLFTENNFVENTFDVTTNSRQNPNTFDGNYWSRYAGYDLAGDGIGDVPYRPVRLFAFIIERRPAAMILLRSLFVDLLDLAEQVLPVLTPETLLDERPLMREVPT